MPRSVLWLCCFCALVCAACGGDGGGGGSSSKGDGGNDKQDAGENEGGSAAHGGSGSGGSQDGGDGDAAAGTGGDGGDSSDPDAATLTDGGLDGGMDAGLFPIDFDANFFEPCTSVDPSPDEITATQQAGVLPTALGDTIHDGVYRLSSFDVYSPFTADSAVRRRLVKFAGNEMTIVYLDGTGPEMDNVGTFSTSGSTLTFKLTCPGEFELMFSYTATATTFALIDADNGTVATYTKQ